MLSMAHHLLVPRAPPATAQVDWRFDPLVFHVAFSQSPFVSATNASLTERIPCVTSRLGGGGIFSQDMITILINYHLNAAENTLLPIE